ncbi:hypothetical protein ACTJKJ_01805 [Roseateles sp. 22389]|uniref:hypothetical protein n=1 Tax=Roseateles sp. 22389 TaxID=3453916 RepID=UPI003F84832D
MPEWLNARPLSATLVVPGTERTREHPEQPAAPKLLGDADHPLRSRAQREPDQAEVLKVSGRAMADAPSNMDRPGSSKLRRRVAAHSPAGLIPSAFPAPMPSFLTGEKNGTPVPLGAHQSSGGMPPVHHSRAAEVRRTPVDPGFSERLDAAKDAFDAAAHEHQAAPGGDTHDALRAAAADLDAVLSSAQLRNLGAAARMHTATRVRLDFAVGELDRIDQQLGAAGPGHRPALEEVERQRPAMQAAAEGAQQIQEYHDAALNAAEHRLVALMQAHPPGFMATEPTPALTAQLRALAHRLPNQPLKEAMSRSSMVEATSRMLAHVTGGDAARGADALRALMDAPTLSWMSTAGNDGAAQAEADVQALFRLMSGVHRGTEVLMLAARDQATIAEVTPQSLDVRAFWRADLAQRQESSEPVRAWLEGAKRAAMASAESGADALISQRDLAALRAVRMGFVSNASDSHYGRVNKRLTKMVTQWIDRAQAPEAGMASRVQQMLGLGGASAADLERGTTRQRQELDPPTLNPLGKKTPLRAGVLERLDTVGASVGVRTPSVQVREHLVAAAHALEQAGGQLIDQAFARREAPSPEIAIGRALGAFMQAHPDLSPTHTPTGDEMASIRAQAREALQGAPVPMPPAGSLLTMAMRAASMLQAVSARSPQPATQDEAQTAALVARANEGLSAAHRLLSPAADARQRFVDDLCAKLDGWDLRTRLRASDGGVVGAGLLSNMSISTPAAGHPLITPVASAQVKREAFIDIFHPMQGLQITAGSIRQAGGELGLSAGPTFKLAEDVLGLRLSGGLKGGYNSTQVDGAIMRIRREPGRLPEMIEHLKNVVRDLAQWDTLRDERGQPFDDAVAALLARNGKLIISDMTQDTSSSVLELSASAGLSVGDPRPGRRNATFGPNASVQLSTERQQQLYADHSGNVRVLNEQVSIAHHKFRATASLTANVGDPNNYPRAPHPAHSAPAPASTPAPAPSPSAAPPDSTGVTGVKGPMLLSGTREFGQSYEKVSVTVLDFAGTIDADHDRFYNSPQPLMAEVELNREQWIQRYLETLSGWTEEQKQTQGRDLAHRDLDRFLEQAQGLQGSNFAHYNIHDTMMPQASGHFETLYMLKDVASVTGNDAMAQSVKADRDQLLNEPSTWRRSTMNLFERGRSSAIDGINVVIKAGRTQGADAQLQIAEYPSRNPAPPPPA